MLNGGLAAALDFEPAQYRQGLRGSQGMHR